MFEFAKFAKGVCVRSPTPASEIDFGQPLDMYRPESFRYVHGPQSHAGARGGLMAIWRQMWRIVPTSHHERAPLAVFDRAVIGPDRVYVGRTMYIGAALSSLHIAYCRCTPARHSLRCHHIEIGMPSLYYTVYLFFFFF